MCDTVDGLGCNAQVQVVAARGVDVQGGGRHKVAGLFMRRVPQGWIVDLIRIPIGVGSAPEGEEAVDGNADISVFIRRGGLDLEGGSAGEGVPFNLGHMYVNAG